MTPPVCHYCGERGIHGSADECIAQMLVTAEILKRTQKLPEQLVRVQKIPMWRSGWEDPD